MTSQDVTEYNLTLTSANTEYSYQIPRNTIKLQFQNRNNNDVRFAFTTGKVASSVSPYQTLKKGDVYFEENLNSNTIIYFASSSAADVVEILTWQ